MELLVTGATGFIGRYLVQELVRRGHKVTAVARNMGRAAQMPWFTHTRFIACDLHDLTIAHSKLLGVPDMVVHLAWPGLPRYSELFHFERNLPADYNFLRAMIDAGTSRVLVTGTCLEYGMKCGMLSESDSSDPQNPYALAKDTLRKFLEALRAKMAFALQWARLFYMFGEGQNPNSLLSQLDRAIDANDACFKMSGGEQLRDYLPVAEVARLLALLVEHPECNGIVNICSGAPSSVRSIVERHIAMRGSGITLNCGFYPYPSFEPMAFWGNPRKIRTCEEVEQSLDG